MCDCMLLCKGCWSNWAVCWGQRTWVKSAELCDAIVHKQRHTLLCCIQESRNWAGKECVHKSPHHQQCCGRQCLRVFWSSVLINQTRERWREKLLWLAGFTISSLCHLPLFSLPNPTTFHLPLSHYFPSYFLFLFFHFHPPFHHPGFHSSPCPLTHLYSYFLHSRCHFNRPPYSTFFSICPSYNWYQVHPGPARTNPSQHRPEVADVRTYPPSTFTPSLLVILPSVTMPLPPSFYCYSQFLCSIIHYSSPALSVFAIPSQSSIDSRHSLSV